MSRYAASHCPLRTCEGELLQLSVLVERRKIEMVLDTLAGLPFPVNPEIVHPETASGPVVVRFPAYGRRLKAILGELAALGFPSDSVRVRGEL